MWWHDTDNLASTLLACLGGVAMLHVGRDRDALRRELLRQGIDIAGADRLDDVRMPLASRGVLLTHVLDEASVERHGEIAKALLERDPRAAMILARLAQGQTREAVEQAWLRAGWRRHPRVLRAVTYENLELEPTEGGVALLLEPVPREALVQHPLEVLAASRGLHMDMLRESSRRSDAHLARYALASEIVRRGDRVLDVACGLGYGTHILRANSDASSLLGIDASDFGVAYARTHYAGPATEFCVGDASDLRSVANASVDVVVCMETLEHIADPTRALREFARVLTPGGRVIVSVPNEWGDTTGPHRNPHHLHEYSWEDLRTQLEAHFLPERRWRQTAGGGRKLTMAPRRLVSMGWENAAREEEATQQAEWWLACAMKSPIGAGKAGYVETIFRGAPDDPGFHVAAFARDYDNPWLVRAMVGIGDRLAHPAGLTQLASTVHTTARAGSPDQGAAVCVLAYQALAASSATTEQLQQVLAWIDAFDVASDGSPHAWRWQVSNRFVAGRLWLALGNREKARAQFAACAGMDVLKFSPLLATKTVEACLLSGIIDMVDGRAADARGWWVRGLEEARRVTTGSWLNVWGTPKRPMSFGMRELSEVLDMASRCAGWLVQADLSQVRPGFAWTRASSLSHAEQRRWTERLNAARVWLDEQRTSWAALAKQREQELTRLTHERGGLQAREQELELARAWHEQQATSWRTQHELAAAKLEELLGWTKQLEGASAWHESQAKHWQHESQRLTEALILANQQHRHWHEQADAREKEVQSLRAWSATLTQAKDWHEEQARAMRTTIEEKDAQLASLHAWSRSLEEARAWQESQAKAFLAQRDEHAKALSSAHEARSALEQERTRLQAAHEVAIQGMRDQLSASRQELASTLDKLAQQQSLITGLEARLAKKDDALHALGQRIESMRTLRGVLRTMKGVLFGSPRERDPLDPGAHSKQP